MCIQRPFKDHGYIICLNYEVDNGYFLSLSGEIRMAFVLYKHLGSYLSTENASVKFSSETLNTNYSIIVNSPIITAAINKDSNKVYLSDPVIFTVRHVQVRVQSHLRFAPKMKSYFQMFFLLCWTMCLRLLGYILRINLSLQTHLGESD